MKFLLFLGIVCVIVLILYVGIDLSPLLSQISGPDAASPEIPSEGIDMFCKLLGFCE